MVGSNCLIDIQDYQFNLKSEKINSIARLVKLGIPTVPFPHLLLPSAYQFYLKNRSLSLEAEKELKSFFNKLQKAGYNISVRPSIFAKIPGVEFIVANSLNLPRLADVIQAITGGYQKIIDEYQQLKEIEFSYLIQGFYTANKAGLVFSNDGAGHVYIEAAFGETTNIFTRGRVQPDVYKVDRETGKIKEKKIAKKKFTLEASESGLRKAELTREEKIKPVFNSREIREIYQNALRMEEKYGPQEIECAVLKTGQLIFQSSRNSQVKIQPKQALSQNIPIFFRPVQGKLIYLHNLRELNLLTKRGQGRILSKDLIVATDKLDIEFITNLVYKMKPKGVILTRGSLTAHAVTILREAKITSILAKGFKLNQKRFVKIRTNGEIELK